MKKFLKGFVIGFITFGAVAGGMLILLGRIGALRPSLSLAQMVVPTVAFVAFMGVVSGVATVTARPRFPPQAS
jgi:hypothetical protein